MRRSIWSGPATAFSRSGAWTNGGTSVAEIIAADPRAQTILDEQRIGTLKPAGPVRVATGIQDDIVPHAQARQLAVDWCRRDGDFTYQAVNLPNLGDKILTNHLAPSSPTRERRSPGSPTA